MGVRENLTELEELIGMKLDIVKEGRATIIVPNLRAYADEHGHIDPARAPVFYNPVMKANRDVAIACANVYSKHYSDNDLRICEPLCATGVRGIRYALEIGNKVREVIMGDINEQAVKLAKINIYINRVEDYVKVYCTEANKLMLNYGKFNVIDIDPFGSPIGFVQNAVRAISHRGLIAVTATDLAPLVGVYPLTCKRRYFSISTRCPFSREIGLRILIASIIREGAMLERALIPLLSYYMDHYFRAYFLVLAKLQCIDDILKEVGYIVYCPNCSGRWVKRGILPLIEGKCPRCNGEIVVCGPLWLGKLAEDRFIALIKEEIEMRRHELSTYRRIERTLNRIERELRLPPFYYRVDEPFLIRRMGRELSPRAIVQILREHGYEASLTHLDPKGFKTDAKLEDIIKILSQNYELTNE
ncbi:MAG: tRNA (guanine(10)-N(2))-dimethyltransferase [Thermoprotei archaeon]|nr:MAG: tRNA (guanine(10)-N(2))-dimethyltransferase [Thermoprotei archaeon]